MTGVFDGYLALVVTCHIIGTVPLYKYWLLVCSPSTVGKCDTGQIIANVCFIELRIIFAFPQLDFTR